MKAITLNDFGDVGNFRLTTVPDPVPAGNEVLVQVKAVSFNPIDCQMRRGAKESGLLRSPILGRECSGVVVETGTDVTAFTPGDKVAAYVGSLASNGTYAELIAIPHQLLAKIPAGLSFEQAATLPLVGLTAWQCLQRLDIPKDEPVFIAGGAGGVGTILIKLLIASGYRDVITTAGNNRSTAHLAALGISPDNIWNYKQTAFCNYLLRQTPSGEFNYCVDLVGGAMSEACASLLKIEGVYGDVANCTTGKARETLFAKAATIVNIANYARALTGDMADAAIYGQKLSALFATIADGLISPPFVQVLGEFGVDPVSKAHLLLEQNQAGGYKLVMLNP